MKETRASAEIVLRPARTTDAETLAVVAARAFHDGWAEIISPEYADLYISRSLTAEKFAHEIADAANHFLLVAADEGDKPIGFAKLNLARAAPDLVTGPAPMLMQRLYLSSEYRGAGVADRLFTAIVAEALRRGAQTIWLECDRRNARAWRFYEKRGWREMGTMVFHSTLPDGTPIVINDRESAMQKIFSEAAKREALDI